MFLKKIKNIKIMKLDLKRLLPYLPYGVKVSHIHVLHHGIGIGSISHILTSSSNRYKIRLRPLSDLTKEIEVNGETFIPASKMITHGFHHYFWYDLNEFDYRYLYAMDLEKLLEWHFDIFGLIEQNLAIDVNKI